MICHHGSQAEQSNKIPVFKHIRAAILVVKDKSFQLAKPKSVWPVASKANTKDLSHIMNQNQSSSPASKPKEARRRRPPNCWRRPRGPELKKWTQAHPPSIAKGGTSWTNTTDYHKEAKQIANFAVNKLVMSQGSTLLANPCFRKIEEWCNRRTRLICFLQLGAQMLSRGTLMKSWTSIAPHLPLPPQRTWNKTGKMQAISICMAMSNDVETYFTKNNAYENIHLKFWFIFGIERNKLF